MPVEDSIGQSVLWDTGVPTKYCRYCKTAKPRTEFRLRKRRNGSTERDSRCKLCKNAYKYKKIAENPDKNRDENYRSRLRRFGMTGTDYNRMVAEQGGVCAICGKPETSKRNTGTVKPLCVDHCHASGNVRALLCNYCNLIIGMAKDNADLLRQAAAYLDTHTAKNQLPLR